MLIEATTNVGVEVMFDTSKVIDWSWNTLAKNTEADPALEVVFDRTDITNMTQRAFFFSQDAQRVAVCLLRSATDANWWRSWT
ncbi:hypothetical protein [Salipiger profundus]|uniref:hypothetical protein n=1 Tax=Salipiger profundus TaxID=1229727 RepID=UPI0008DF3DED|nr:hypothetical protein [Salipiger profundus]SFC09111.1 hypothetical protein SAMN05444415_10276 [Salipiger profundus]